MYFLLSGEGSTDMGSPSTTAPIPICEGEDFKVGPMGLIVAQLVEQKTGVAFLKTGAYGFVYKKRLEEKAKRTNFSKLPGKKNRKETAYFYWNARALAQYAKEKEAEIGKEIVAVLFRDADGTVSAERSLWEDKHQSMMQGFHAEDFMRGVPMVPKPKSEAWIICAVQKNSYQNCEKLENRSGNDSSPKSLKKELRTILNGKVSSDDLCTLVEDRTIDVDRIDMPSFTTFKTVLQTALASNEQR